LDSSEVQILNRISQWWRALEINSKRHRRDKT
jgi:hypothetical protein